MTEFTIEADALRQAFVTALAFASTDKTLPMINTVSIKPATATTIEVAASDRFALSVETLVIDDGDPFEVNIPSRVVEQLVGVLPEDDGRLVAFTHDNGRVTVAVDGPVETSLTFEPLAVPFVDYGKLLAEIEADTTGPVPAMGFACKILARVCAAIAERPRAGSVMKVTFRGASQGVVIENDATYKAVVMPVDLAQYERFTGEVVA